MTDKESVKVLQECIDLQLKKSQDYQNPNSNVKQAMHYRRGVDTIHDTMQGKMYRAQSLLESNRADQANFESLEDTYKDLINYASFAVAWLRGGIDGQDPNRDIFNKPRAHSRFYYDKDRNRPTPPETPVKDEKVFFGGNLKGVEELMAKRK